MTIKPIQGAPIDAPIPDFPTGKRPAEPSPFSLPPPVPSPPPAPAWRPGPVEFRGSGNSILTFRSIPEIPAINRSSLTISITGEPTGDFASRMMPHLDLAADKAKLFLLALRDGRSPIVIADSPNGFQVEFAMTEDGPTFTVSKPGQARTSRKFIAGSGDDVKVMAAHLLADLGP
jgi:hypothetical protein